MSESLKTKLREALVAKLQTLRAEYVRIHQENFTQARQLLLFTCGQEGQRVREKLDALDKGTLV